MAYEIACEDPDRPVIRAGTYRVKCGNAEVVFHAPSDVTIGQWAKAFAPLMLHRERERAKREGDARQMLGGDGGRPEREEGIALVSGG